MTQIPEEGELVYRVRKMNNRFWVGLPAEVGEKLEGKTFKLSFVDEGMLYRPIEVLPDEGLPAWLSAIVSDEPASPE